MAYNFDGDNKIITVSGVTEFTMIELYRAAREWEDDADNMIYTSPADALGKNSLQPDVFTDIVYILTNGWKLKPSGYIAGTTIKVEGTVITDDDTEPTVPATTGSPVTWVFKVAYSGIITNVATGSGLSTAEHNKLMALPEDAGLTPTQEQTLNEIDINVESVKQTAEDNQGLIISAL